MNSDISGISSLYTTDYWKDSTRTSELEGKLSVDKENVTKDELMSVCKDFETYFAEQMFKSMKKMVPESDLSNSKEMNMFGDMLTQKYAEAATQKGELGLAQMLYEQMKRNYGLE